MQHLTTQKEPITFVSWCSLTQVTDIILNQREKRAENKEGTKIYLYLLSLSIALCQNNLQMKDQNCLKYTVFKQIYAHRVFPEQCQYQGLFSPLINKRADVLA